MKNIFNSKKALRIYGICTFAITAVCVILRLVTLLFFFDIEIGYYQSGFVPALATYLPYIFVVASAIFCFLPMLHVTPNEPYNTKAVKITAFFPAIGFAAWFITYALSIIEYNNTYGSVPLMYIIMALSAILGSMFFWLIALQKKHNTGLYVIAGIFTVVWSITSLADSYFDIYVQMNSPTKLIFQFATLSFMLLCINEMRIAFDLKRPRFHLFSVTSATILLATSSIPSVICCFTGNMPTNYVLLYSDCVFLLLLVFAVTRLIQLCFNTNQETSSRSAEELTNSDTTPESDGTVSE